MKDWWYLICDCLFDIAIPYKYISIWNGMYCVPVICKLMFLIKYNWHLANKAHTTFIDVLWLMGERARENNNNNKRMGTFVYDNKPLKINGIANLINLIFIENNHSESGKSKWGQCKWEYLLVPSRFFCLTYFLFFAFPNGFFNQIIMNGWGNEEFWWFQNDMSKTTRIFFYNRRLRKTQTHTATQKKITQHDKTQLMTRNRIQLKNTKMN